MQCYMQAEALAIPLFLHTSAHSDAEHGFTSMRKGGREINTPQERKKQSTLDLSHMAILHSKEADTQAVINEPSTVR
jgi:hypothetical protein